MIIRYATIILTLAGTLSLLIGLLYWAGLATQMMTMHIPLGLLTVGALWVIAVAQALAKGGSWVIAVNALVLGAVMIVYGLLQAAWMVGPFHWVVRIVHLILGIAMIGVGHMAAAHHRRRQ